MRFIIALGLLIFVLFPAPAMDLLTPERLIGLIRESNADWQKEDAALSGSLAEAERNSLSYGNVWTVTPAYTFFAPMTRDGSEFPLTNTPALTLGFSRRLPTNGTLEISLEEGFIATFYDGNSYYGQSPSLGFSFTQPLLTGGRLFNRDSFDGKRRITIDIPRSMAHARDSLNRSRLTARILNLYYDLILSSEDYRLSEKKQELTSRELTQLSSLRERGLYSGTDFWQKQLEAEQEKDDLLEKHHNLQSARRNLASELGMGEDDFTLPRPALSLESLPPLPDRTWEDWPESSREWQLANWEAEEARLRIDGALEETPSYLTADFTLAPDYLEDEPSLRDLSHSFTDLFLPETPLTAEFSIAFSYSPSTNRYNRLTEKIGESRARASEMEKTEKEEELRTKKKDLENREGMLSLKLERINESIDYLKILHEKEQKLLELSSSTPLAVEETALNLELRELDRQTALVELFRNRLEILSLTGRDIGSDEDLIIPGEK